MQLKIDRESRVPIYLQLKNQLRSLIYSGELSAGSQLPPERKLADSLGLNRTTVLTAYRELKADGLVDSHVGKGTVVLPVLSEVSDRYDGYEVPSFRQFFSQTAERANEPLLRDLLQMANRKDIISFSAGISSMDNDPVEALMGLEKELLEQPEHFALKHTPTEGLPSLRQNIAKLMRERGTNVSPDEVLVLSGSQQGIALSAEVFIDPGDVVLVEEPSFFSALQIFNAAGARVVGVPVDENGMKVDVLEQLLKRHRPKLIYTMPTFQNPSGITMSLERRRRLLELAYQEKVLILEDDPYGEIRFEGPRLPSLLELDAYGYVIYLSTFSKILFPGIRIGWMVAHKQVIHQFTMQKQLCDLHANSISQWIVDRFLESGSYAEHVEKLRKEYKEKRDIMVEALMNSSIKGLEWTKPLGGFYVWCRLPEGTPHMALLVNAADRGVSYIPGTAFFTGGRGGGYMRLNYTYPDKKDITTGIQRLKAAIEAVSRQPGKATEGLTDIKPIV
ncbi:MAG: PLP-dependent aminotransferase family protein [Clostridia bacterium]|nr:PLP-dependent aminotransferase family protein [Clostridia bacterium]